MQFEFKAYTREGKLKEGIISADNKEAALQILQNQELLVTYLSEKRLSLVSYLFKPNIRDIYFFTKQLSYLIKSRTPLDESIRALSEAMPNSALRSILVEIYNDLISGITFSQSLARFPDIFDSYYVGMIKIGESVGVLDETLEYLAQHLYAQFKFKNRLIQASIYPIIVVFIFLGVLFALFYYVVPQIVAIFAENNVPMPLITKIFKSIADLLLQFGLFILGALILLGFYFYDYLFKTSEGKATLFKLVSDVPILGSLIKNNYSAQFLESLYHLSKGGVPIVEALEIIKDSFDNPLYVSALEYIVEDVKKGSPLSESLSNFPDLFQSFMIEGIKTAEKTGELAEVTLTLYNFYNEIVENQVTNLSEALQPILILLLGAALGLLEASLLIPLLTLTKYVQSF